jgi:hypothetical protein
MRLIISFIVTGVLLLLPAHFVRAAVTWKTFVDGSITYKYPAWAETEPTRIWQSATGASPTLAVNEEGYCSFTMAYEPKGLTGNFKTVIPARLTTRAAEVNGSVLFSNITAAYFESQVIYPYLTNGTETTLIQATYGYRVANGGAYYLAYTSDLNNFEGECKQLMFTTMASLKQRASAKEKLDAKSAAIVTKVSIGTYKKSSGKPMVPATTFRDQQQFCYSATLTKNISAKTIKHIFVRSSDRAIMSQSILKSSMKKGSMTSCGTFSATETPAGKYEFRLYYNGKMVSKLPFTVK